VSCAPTTDRSRRQILKFARQRKFKDKPTGKLRHLLTTVQGKVKKVQGNDACPAIRKIYIKQATLRSPSKHFNVTIS
jgi:hypothetical protein